MDKINKKPNIEEVYNLFNRHIITKQMILNQKPNDWAKQMINLQVEFKKHAERIGIAQHIDWSDNQ